MTVFILGNCVVVLDNSFSTNGNDAEKTVFVWDFPLINYQLPQHKKKANNNNIFEWLEKP